MTHAVQELELGLRKMVGKKDRCVAQGKAIIASAHDEARHRNLVEPRARVEISVRLYEVEDDVARCLGGHVVHEVDLVRRGFRTECSKGNSPEHRVRRLDDRTQLVEANGLTTQQVERSPREPFEASDCSSAEHGLDRGAVSGVQESEAFDDVTL